MEQEGTWGGDRLAQGREVGAREKGGLEDKGGLTLGQGSGPVRAGVCEGQSRPADFIQE